MSASANHYKPNLRDTLFNLFEFLEIGKTSLGKKPFGDLDEETARQTLESCVTCHTERDCLLCHSATAGRHFNPHGPGFNAERLARRNPQTCSACHGRTIPTR